MLSGYNFAVIYTDGMMSDTLDNVRDVKEYSQGNDVSHVEFWPIEIEDRSYAIGYAHACGYVD